jgi:hypothetical protein
MFCYHTSRVLIVLVLIVVVVIILKYQYREISIQSSYFVKYDDWQNTYLAVTNVRLIDHSTSNGCFITIISVF